MSGAPRRDFSRVAPRPFFDRLLSDTAMPFSPFFRHKVREIDRVHVCIVAANTVLETPYTVNSQIYVFRYWYTC